MSINYIPSYAFAHISYSSKCSISLCHTQMFFLKNSIFSFAICTSFVYLWLLIPPLHCYSPYFLLLGKHNCLFSIFILLDFPAAFGTFLCSLLWNKFSVLFKCLWVFHLPNGNSLLFLLLTSVLLQSSKCWNAPGSSPWWSSLISFSPEWSNLIAKF